MRIFNPAISPAAPLNVTLQAKVTSIGFGDGYSEDTPEGINSVTRTVKLTWTAPASDIRTVYDFLKIDMGHGRIKYTIHGDFVAALWKVTALDLLRRASGLTTLNATFEEVFL